MDASRESTASAGLSGQERRCSAGEWVEIERVLLAPSERAEGLPLDTAGKPLVLWVKGFAQGAAVLGEALTVETMSGRLVSGRLSAVEPGYFQTFGAPIAELNGVGRDLRARVAAYRAAEGTGAAPGGSDAGAAR